MNKIRISFLPAFFVTLSIVFATALVFRIRSEGREDRRPPMRVITPPDTGVVISEHPPVRPRTATSGPSSDNLTIDEQPKRSVIPPPSLEPGVEHDEVSRLVEQVSFESRAAPAGRAPALLVRLRPNSDIETVSGTLEYVSRGAKLPLQCSLQSALIWTCRASVPACVACGQWHVGQLQLTARGGKGLTISGDHSLLSFARISLSSERCDSVPPTLNAVTMQDADVEGNSQTPVVFTLTLADDYCGIGSIAGYAESAKGERLPFTAALSGDENTWAGHITVSRATERGKWHVAFVELVDNAGNFKDYSAADAVLRDATFQVR